MQHRVVTDYSNVKGNETVKVFVRLRPPADGSNVSKQHIKDLDKSNKITILDPRDQTAHTGNEHTFAFNEVFNTDTNQENVFLQVSEPLVTQTLRGYNTCCFAYGQTGSGKTYSMFGPPGDDTVGIIPRAVNDVFQRLVQIQEDKETAVVVSFLEMYCDQIRDLGKAYLDKDTGNGDSGSRQTTTDWYEENKRRQAGKFRPGSRGNSGSRNGSGRRSKTPNSKSVGISGTRFAPRGVGLATASEYVSQDLTIHEDSMGNVFVKDLSVIPVSTPEECLTVVQMGFKLRATHETKMNAVSSRSHTVFTLTIVQKDRVTGETITGMLNLVDLAGSERLHKSESTGQRMKEALAINGSLTALGKVIMALDPGSKGSHIPYRDSKLTRLLQNSLGGNSYTALLATLHPQEKHYEESLSTLQFANRCRNVRNQPRVNYIDQGGGDREKRLKKLLQELQTLKRQLSSMEARHQAQIIALMADLGIEGELMPDGRFQTANGEVLGITATAATGAVEENGGVAGSAQEILNATSGDIRGGRSGRGSGARGARALAGGKLGGAGIASQLKKQLANESRDKQKFKQKMHMFKNELDSLKEKYEQESDRLNLHVKRQHDQIQNLTEELQELQGGAAAQLELERQRHKDEISTVVNNNKILLAKTAQRLKDVPKSLQVSSEVLRESRNAAARMKASTEAQYNKLIDELNKSHELKLENMKEQYDFLASKKKTEQEKFVEDFNKYYAKKSSELSEYKNELVQLYNHCNMLSTIVSKVEQNAYPVRQLATGVKVFAIPAKDKPHDIFKDKSRLLHLREQLASSRRAVKRLQAADKSHAPPTMPEIKPPSANQARPRRPPSAGYQRPYDRNNNDGILPPSRDNNPIPVVNMTQDDYDAPLLYPQVDGNGGLEDVGNFGSSEDLNKKKPEELADEVVRLRQYIQTGLRKKVEEQVLNDLAGHETIG